MHVNACLVLSGVYAAVAADPGRLDAADPKAWTRDPVRELVAAYAHAFGKRQFLSVAACFADSYFERKGVRRGDFAAQLEKDYPKEGRFHLRVLKLEAEPSKDGRAAKGYFLYQLTGKRAIIDCDGKHRRRLAYTFHRADFVAGGSAGAWRFTQFQASPSEDARQIKVDRMLARLKPYMEDPKRTALEKARRLADVSFFYYMHGDQEKAADAARRSMEFHELSSGHSCLAHALKKLGRYDEAIEHFRKAALTEACSVPTKYIRQWIRECKVLKGKALAHGLGRAAD